MNILIVITSKGTIGKENKLTGFHFSEFSHPYEFFIKHGYNVTVASPLGGESPITSPHPEDKINAQFYTDPQKMKVIKETKKLSSIKDQHFDAVFIAGGHGPMLDLANNPVLAEILKTTYESGGVLGSVCHGPACFVGAKDSNGEFLIKGKRINSFTEAEEQKTEYINDIPFQLESKLKEQGAKFESSGIREGHLCVDSGIVTGQNPESVELVIGAMYALLQNKTGHQL